MVEYEHSRDSNVEGLADTLIALKEWRVIVARASTGDEFETVLSVQAQYRYRPMRESAVAVYAAQNYPGIGPVLMAAMRLNSANS